MALLPAFDVSRWQDASLGSLKGYYLGIARASVDEIGDTTYESHITQIVAGVRWAGAYHAGYGDHSGAAQAAFFLARLAAVKAQPHLLMIDTREFGMTVEQCNAFIAYCAAHDPLKRPMLVYDSEGNWTGPYVPHAADAVANYSKHPVRPFVYWQDADHGGPARGDHGWVDPVVMDRILASAPTPVVRQAPRWTVGPANAEVQLGPGKIIYQLDGRTRYSQNGPAATTFKAPGLATGWTMIQDGSVFAAVLNRDLVKGA